jgi:hypothetical protein
MALIRQQWWGQAAGNDAAVLEQLDAALDALRAEAGEPGAICGHAGWQSGCPQCTFHLGKVVSVGPFLAAAPELQDARALDRRMAMVRAHGNLYGAMRALQRNAPDVPGALATIDATMNLLAAPALAQVSAREPEDARALVEEARAFIDPEALLEGAKLRTSESLILRLADALERAAVSALDPGTVSGLTVAEIHALEIAVGLQCTQNVRGPQAALRGLLARAVASATAPQVEPRASQGAAMIAAERGRQVSVEGWGAEHDDVYVSGSLVRAAVAYLMQVVGGDQSGEQIRRWWPWSFDFWKPKSALRDLVRAGALIAAEIDRRLRAGEKP